jgi:RNA polymerase sigma-70 factor (ECF subfamily)
VRDLVERAKRGDLEAFGRLVELFQDAVYGAAYALLGDFHDAQDAAQDAFIRAWRSLNDLQDPDKFPGWLYRVTRNCCVDFLRKSDAETVPLDEATEPSASSKAASPPDQLEAVELREGVLAAIRSLSERNRLTTTLFYIDGYTVEEVAQFLEVPAGTVKRRLHDSRRQLRERMVAMVEDELKGSRPGPEFREGVMREISRVEVRPEKSPTDQGRVLLLDKEGRCLPILIGKVEELAIYRGTKRQKPPRPLTHELFLSALEAFGIHVKEARVVDLKETTFIAELVLERQGEERVLDSRPSDAIALAMMTGARITVAESVMQKGGVKRVRSEEDLEKVWQSLGDPEQFNQGLSELCGRLQSLSEEALAQIACKVGPKTIGTALAVMSERILEETPSGKRVVAIAFAPTTEPEARKGLPAEVAGALKILFERLERAGVRIDASCLPRGRGGIPRDAINTVRPEDCFWLRRE